MTLPYALSLHKTYHNKAERPYVGKLLGNLNNERKSMYVRMSLIKNLLDILDPEPYHKYHHTFQIYNEHWKDFEL